MMKSLKKSTAIALLAFGAVSASGTMCEAGVVLYSQLDNEGSNGISAQDFETANDQYDAEAAVDFTIPAGQTWNITEVFTKGTNASASSPPDVNIRFYNDNAGTPEDIAAYEFLGLAQSGIEDLTTPIDVTLGPGTYWMGQQVVQDFPTGGQYYWKDRTVMTGNEAHWRNPGDGFALASSWTPLTTVGSFGPDLLFELRGSIVSQSAVPEPTSLFSFSIIFATIPIFRMSRRR